MTSNYIELMHCLVRAGYQPQDMQCYVHDDVDENGHRWNGNHPIFGQCAKWTAPYNPALPDIVLFYQTCNAREDGHEGSGTVFTGTSSMRRFGFDVRGTKEHDFDTVKQLQEHMKKLGISEYRDVHFKPKAPRKRLARAKA